MESIKLSNNSISVRINFKGAEISSIYNNKSEIEHVWQADKDVWARHAPILFPIVGQVKNSEYAIDGKKYNLSQHGFARDRKFELDEITQEKAVFKLDSDQESLKVYPFKFALYVIYILKDNRLSIEYKVQNCDSNTIYFSIGAHPGFTVPFNQGEEFSDYKLVFSKEEKVDKLLLSNTGLLSDDVVSNFLNHEKEINLNYDVFSKDALIFENTKSEYVDIVSKAHNNKLRISIESFPYLGIWTKPGANAPFVCIEPWYGITDSENSTGDFKNKRGIQKLEIGEEFNANYYMEVY